jgi:hypothetical protein
MTEEAFDPLVVLRLRHEPPKKDPNKQWPYKLTHFNDLRPRDKSPHIVEGLIPLNGLVTVWGPAKGGKSFWVFDLVMHVALGWPYRGLRVEQGPVVYCAFEGADGFNERAEAFRRTHPRIKEHTDTWLDGPWFHLLACNAKLVRDHKALIVSIRGQSNGRPPTVVVLDTLNRSIDGSESKDIDMTAYLSAAEAICDAFDCVVIIVHHCGVDQHRPRGHTSLTGAAAVQIAVRRDAQDNIVAEVEYMKDGPEGATFTSTLEVVEVGIDRETKKPISSCAIMPVEDPPARVGKKKGKKKLTDEQTRFLDILNDAILDAPAEHKSTVHGNLAISREWLKQCCISQGWSDEDDSKDVRRAKVNNFINKLAGKRVVGTNKLYIWPVR